MYNQKLCITAFGLNLPPYEDIYAYKRAGFDGLYVGFERESTLRYAEIARKEGMIISSLHAPFKKANSMWREDGERSEEAVRELIESVDLTAEVDAHITVCHAWIGFDTPDIPNQLGLDRYKKVVDHAAERGVQIAFENTEGEEFLAALMDYFKGNETVGFCWDTGHEQCYNHGTDMMALYGDRLIATHLDDNLGISDYGGHTFWTDDLHLLPFDGISDWQSVAGRMAAHGYKGPLTLEVSRFGKYLAMTAEQYIATAYASVARIGAMMNRAEEAAKK